jgi:hypothetical protein
MESALRRMRDLADRFAKYQARVDVEDADRHKELGLIQAEFSHVMMMAINWETLAQMDPLGMSKILAAVPVGTWAAVFRRADKPHLRKILMGIADAEYDVLAELLQAYPVEKIAEALRKDEGAIGKMLEAVEKAKGKW